ncbi:hypothetical protein OH77DRAFT_1260924 [Trametes cingulata]|nr:hypothetical protein OH77DRAFT_1260924 [Trametes cingulata]
MISFSLSREIPAHLPLWIADVSCEPLTRRPHCTYDKAAFRASSIDTTRVVFNRVEVSRSLLCLRQCEPITVHMLLLYSSHIVNFWPQCIDRAPGERFSSLRPLKRMWLLLSLFMILMPSDDELQASGHHTTMDTSLPIAILSVLELVHRHSRLFIVRIKMFDPTGHQIINAGVHLCPTSPQPIAPST